MLKGPMNSLHFAYKNNQSNCCKNASAIKRKTSIGETTRPTVAQHTFILNALIRTMKQQTVYEARNALKCFFSV